MKWIFALLFLVPSILFAVESVPAKKGFLPNEPGSVLSCSLQPVAATVRGSSSDECIINLKSVYYFIAGSVILITEYKTTIEYRYSLSKLDGTPVTNGSYLSINFYKSSLIESDPRDFSKNIVVGFKSDQPVKDEFGGPAAKDTGKDTKSEPVSKF